MAEYADKLYSRKRGNTVAVVNANYEATINAVSGGHHHETSPHDRGRERRSWWTLVPSAVSFRTVRKRHRPALSFPSPTGKPFRAGGASAAA
jgi:hypothetical protein